MINKFKIIKLLKKMCVGISQIYSRAEIEYDIHQMSFAFVFARL